MPKGLRHLNLFLLNEIAQLLPTLICGSRLVVIIKLLTHDCQSNHANFKVPVECDAIWHFPSGLSFLYRVTACSVIAGICQGASTQSIASLEIDDNVRWVNLRVSVRSKGFCLANRVAS